MRKNALIALFVASLLGATYEAGRFAQRSQTKSQNLEKRLENQVIEKEIESEAKEEVEGLDVDGRRTRLERLLGVSE